MIKKILCITLSVLTVLPLSACNKKTYETVQYKKDDSIIENLDFGGEAVTVMYDGSSCALIEEYLKNTADFENAQKKFNVKINFKKQNISLAAEKLSDAKPEAQIYIVSNGDNNNIYDMAVKGYLSDLTGPLIKTGTNENLSSVYSVNYSINKLNGKQWSAGFSLPSATVVLYNKKLLNAAGFTGDKGVEGLIKSQSWTWSAMTEMAKKLTLKNSNGEITNWGISLNPESFAAIALSNDGHIIHPNDEGVFLPALEDENTIEALTQIFDWYHSQKVATTYLGYRENQRISDFASGKVAFMFADSKDIYAVANAMNTNDLGVAFIPKGPKSEKYTTALSTDLSFVIPADYSNNADNLVALMNQLFGIADDNAEQKSFEALWKNTLTEKSAYDMLYSIYFGNETNLKWDASTALSAEINYGSLLSGNKNAPAFAEENQILTEKLLTENYSGYTY